MVDFEFRLTKENLLKNLKEANEYADEQHGTDIYFTAWGGKSLELVIQDDYLWTESGDSIWVSIDATEFTPEMLILLFEMNPALANEAVLQSLLKAAGIK